jgi:homogentisate 1,2-dioxygenase
MPIYHKLGNFPQKRHTVFQSPEGKHYYEQLFGTEGFNGHSTLSYHVHRPTQVKEILKSYSVQPKIAIDKNIKSLLLKGFEIKPTADFLESRKTVLLNGDCHIGLAAPTESLTNYFYKNADADELIFIHKGKGKLRTFLGNIHFEYGDYLIIPRGMIYQIEFETSDNRLFYVESFCSILYPETIQKFIRTIIRTLPFL